jgi:hypothetical protein
MRRLLIPLAAALVVAAIAVPVALAGSAHFVNNSFEVTRSNNTLTVSGKEAGLGDLEQVNIEVTATALCINPGGNHPRAVNKASLSEDVDVPVQNGKAEFTVMLTATFQPECSPPMTVSFTDIVVTDTTNNISTRLRGTF